MRRFFVFIKGYLLVGTIFIVFARCSSEEDPPSPTYSFNLPSEIYRVVNQKQLDDLKNAGMTIHEGTSPPNIAQTLYSPRGIPIGTTKVRFLVDHTCIFDNKNPANVGVTYDSFQDSIYIFPNANKVMEASLQYISKNDRGSGTGFASGAGDNFSLFINVTNGQINQVSYKALWVISGTLLESQNGIYGIENLQDCFLMLEKGEDPGDQVANPGTIRIFKDSIAQRDW